MSSDQKAKQNKQEKNEIITHLFHKHSLNTVKVLGITQLQKKKGAKNLFH
jgi:hypothetical protein